MEAIRVEGLSFTYPGSHEAALSDIELSVEQGSYVVLVGPNASGKSTLLKLIKREVAPHGSSEGTILISGMPQASMSPEESTRTVGFVMQNPNAQLVTDTVYHELAFALENLGEEPTAIRRRVAEVATFFGIAPWTDSKTADLSEGQKQIVNLASIIALGPKIVLLDEPTAQLDPIATDDFVNILRKVNRELGITVVLATHSLDEFSPDADRVITLESSRVLMEGSMQDYLDFVFKQGEKPGLPIPGTARVVYEAGVTQAPYPVTVRDARAALIQADTNVSIDYREETESDSYVLGVQDVWFQYEKRSPVVLQGVDLAVTEGSAHALLGSNGSGKSTLLKLLVGVGRPIIGKISRSGGKRFGLLVQDPVSLFRHETVAEEWGELSAEGQEVIDTFKLAGLAGRHPYDLSGGEQQLVALVMLMDKAPDVVLLDEPTKGLDVNAKQRLRVYLDDLTRRGKTVLFTTHDLEFASQAAQICSLMFKGSIAASEPTRQFFSGNLFYTTIMNRIGVG